MMLRRQNQKGSLLYLVVGILLSGIYVNLRMTYSNESVDRQTVKEVKQSIFVSKCPKLQEPGQVFSRNKYYQFFQHRQFNLTHFFIAIYYDNRTINRQPVLRTNIVTTGDPRHRLHQNQCQQMGLHVVIWSSQGANPISTRCTCQIMFSADRWEVNGLRYYVSHWECPAPQMDWLPEKDSVYVSLTSSLCDQPTTYLPITVPRKLGHSTDEKPNREIAVIMKSWFGNWTKSFAPYFVSWMECMKAFNVSHVFASADALFVQDISMRKAIDYYKDTGFLSLPRVPTNFEEVETPHSSFSIDQIGMFLSVNDIYYKNMYKYWYFVLTDIDEILVPKKRSSLQLSLEYLLQSDQSFTRAGSIASPMSLFYMDYEPGSSSHPEHLPIFRQTYRQHIERTRRNGVEVPDATKSFMNPQYCLLVGIHYCYLTSDNITKVLYSTEDHFLVHHYRNSCKKSAEQCNEDKITRFRDNFFDSHLGQRIGDQITNILRKIHYKL